MSRWRLTFLHESYNICFQSIEGFLYLVGIIFFAFQSKQKPWTKDMAKDKQKITVKMKHDHFFGWNWAIDNTFVEWLNSEQIKNWVFTN